MAKYKRIDGKIVRVKEENEQGMYLIWNRTYVGNSLVFWREGKAGYTTDIDKAHKFTHEQALSTIGSSDHKLISWDYLQKIATKQINNEHLDRDQLGKEASNG